MVKTNGAYPMPPFDPRFNPGPSCCGKPGMNYIGRRTNEWLENKVDAKAEEVYYNEDTNEYWMSIGYNRWEKWQGVGSSPVPPTPETDKDIYIGTLSEYPEDISALNELEKKVYSTKDLKTGIKITVPADEQYVVFAYQSAIGPISSIMEGGIEAISDFEKITIDDYVFYCTSGEIYDPDAEVEYTITWGIN